MQEHGQGIGLVVSMADKLQGQLIELANNERRLGIDDCFTDVIMKYAAKQDEELINKLDNLKGVVTDFLSLSYSAELFSDIYSVADSDNKFIIIDRRAAFLSGFYDTAEMAATIEFSYLQDIVYDYNVITTSSYYKVNNELDKHFNIISDILELVLNEDPENLYDTEVRQAS